MALENLVQTKFYKIFERVIAVFNELKLQHFCRPLMKSYCQNKRDQSIMNRKNALRASFSQSSIIFSTLKILFFAENMQYVNSDPEAIFLCSFNISSFFTNISLKTTDQIFANALCNSGLVHPNISNALFTEILTAATTLIEFSFIYTTHKQIDTMHKQIGGVALGSLHGLALANVYLLDTTTRNCFDEPANQSCISAALIKLLLFSTRSPAVTVSAIN